MTEITHQPCPYVECQSSNAFCWNTEKNVGHCKSCGDSYPKKGVKLKDLNLLGWVKETYILESKYQKSEEGWKTEEEIEEDSFWDEYEMSDEVVEKYVPVGELSIGKEIRRGILPKTQDHYGVEVFYDEDNVAVKEVYKYPSGGTKTRYIQEKEFSSSGGVNELFGMQLFPPSSAKKITITEGELDAMSARQMLCAGNSYLNPVVSLPSATPSNKMWESCREYLDSFDQIILSIDNDKAGDKVAEKISKMFIGKVYRVNHGSYKDANNFLTDAKGKEFVSAWFGAKKVKPDSILSDSEDLIELYKNTPDYEYCPTGIPELDKKMLGLHKAAFTLILAPTGIGKTEFMRYLEYQVLTKSDYSIGFCHIEETDLRSTLGLVSYELGINATRKDLVEKADLEEKVYESMRKLTEEGRYNQFKMNADDGPVELVEKIRFLVTVMGVDYIFFEPIQDIVSGNTSDKESKLTDLSNTLKRLAAELNVGLVFIAHANEDGDAKYCKSLVQSAAYEIVLNRDPEADDEDEANTTHVSVGRKNRVGGGSGPAGTLNFDMETYTLQPIVFREPPTPKTKGDF